jgi:hypothetical protein
MKPHEPIEPNQTMFQSTSYETVRDEHSERILEEHKSELQSLHNHILPIVGIVMGPNTEMIGALDWFFTEDNDDLKL